MQSSSFVQTVFKAAAFVMMALLTSPSANAQQDTLHLNYHFTQIAPHDSTSKKIDAWIKSLNGKRVDISVVAYYHKAEFRKFAQERCDELYLVLNRKARAQLNIGSIGPKKGKDWQRTMVDIVYSAPSGVVSKPVTPKETEGTEEKKPGEVKPEKKDKTEVAQKNDGKPAGKKEPEVKRETADEQRPSGPLKAVGNSPDLEKYTRSSDADLAVKTLVVALPGDEGAEYEKAKKKGDQQLGEYRKFAQSFNDAARGTFNQRWKYTKVIFVPMSEAQKMVKDNDKIVALYTKKEGGALPVLNFDVKSPVYENSIKVTLSGANPDESDFIMLQHKIARLLNVRSEFERDQLGELLATRKLYIGRDQLDMPQEQIAQNYPYPFEVVDNAEAARIAANGETGAVYLKAETVKGTMNLVLVDAPTGLMLARAPGATKGKLNAKTLSDLVNESLQLQEITPLTVY
jgi:hypothetical protein